MAAAREYSITYNGLTIPSVISGCQTAIHGRVRVLKSSREFEVDFQVCLYGASSAANFATALTSIENTFRQPEGNLNATLTTIGGGGDIGVLINLDFSNNEGLNVEASIEKAGTDADSGRSRLYNVSITGELPWTVTGPAAGQQGLRDFSYAVEFSPSRRAMLTLDGEYTVQSGGTGATAQYTANISALYSAILTALGFGTWPTVGQPEKETRTPDKNDQTIAFTRVYKEIVLAERLGLTDDPQVIKQELRIERVIEPSSSDPSSTVTEAPERLIASYGAAIDQTATRDLKGIWESKLRDWVISNIRALTNQGGRLVLVSESFQPDLVENTITATLEFLSYRLGGNISLSIVETVTIDPGHIISKTWPTASTRTTKDLEPTPAYVFDGPKTIEKTVITTRTTSLGHKPFDLFVGGITGRLGGTTVVGGAGGKKIVVKSRSTEFYHRRQAVAGIGDVIELLDEIVTETVELVGKVP